MIKINVMALAIGSNKLISRKMQSATLRLQHSAVYEQQHKAFSRGRAGRSTHGCQQEERCSQRMIIALFSCRKQNPSKRESNHEIRVTQPKALFQRSLMKHTQALSV